MALTSRYAWRNKTRSRPKASKIQNHHPLIQSEGETRRRASKENKKAHTRNRQTRLATGFFRENNRKTIIDFHSKITGSYSSALPFLISSSISFCKLIISSMRSIHAPNSRSTTISAAIPSSIKIKSIHQLFICFIT